MNAAAVAFENEAVRLTEAEPGIWLFRMTRPREMNTLTSELLDGLQATIAHCRKVRTRALILTGEGRAFCCGAHLRYFAGPQAIFHDPQSARDRYLVRIAELFDELEACAFPTIAAVNGYALGGGCEMALSCDLRVLSSEARIGLPETKLGAIAGAGGVQKLIRHVGRSKALEWILLARHVDAATADAHGLAAAVVPPDQVLPRALELARELRALAPLAVSQSKATIYASEDADLRSARRYGVDALAMLVGGREWREGMSAFLEKRAPEFEAW
ncbi:enoyl-CoA hydratase/isomerase family protein [Caldimonas thermodepolymerans]|jgi:Enoyl-CoA hydratase/carnithine racemase|uniref:Crotonase n=1 Tax=Caldimonas thermodepolymerans TaxID=215580 RepID=A0A2S5T5C7_9BURK|nr:enoyl-CoA hydratase-related protein [Caldimonas thermodepolymerans]PPE70200.1 crotonase [Caldimonas thermodepolymerans]QPC32194.1 enoyl-CoA hydratase/isomerase family protein [Caldimonas thermodepolymerans]RDH98082.1 short chain enoyl-CoA hydratase [Caldimonas thermodepolymerans]TCP08143.1 short chain enoyl-CoA hydratase [Caldimonas thermodepolymerans]UZG48740.1 enoyl-CoA hydratase-related protein [Caldimonas thermodepolymerans]